MAETGPTAVVTSTPKGSMMCSLKEDNGPKTYPTPELLLLRRIASQKLRNETFISGLKCVSVVMLMPLSRRKFTRSKFLLLMEQAFQLKTLIALAPISTITSDRTKITELGSHYIKDSEQFRGGRSTFLLRESGSLEFVMMESTLQTAGSTFRVILGRAIGCCDRTGKFPASILGTGD